MTQRIYTFKEGNAQLKALLGGKGANLAEMTNMGLPVPSGFTITTEVCNAYISNQKQFPPGLTEEIQNAVKTLESETGKELNSSVNPLLVSVRSGASVSMPGMMDTILNLGLNDQAVEGLATLTKNPTFAYDCYRRLLQMFGDVVFGIDKSLFERQLARRKQKANVTNDAQLGVDDLQKLCESYKEIYLDELDRPFPQDPYEQLTLAVEAVFASWDNPRAHIYRDANGIPHDLGTAVNIQIMVFGNSGDTSGTGVLFTRNPANGEKKLFGEYLLNAQGEDVVAGIRTPYPIQELGNQIPSVYQQILEICDTLEHHFADMQDIEFTIEQEKLYLLQTRSGKRTAKAAFQIASDLVDEGLLSKEEAVLRIEPNSINQLLHPIFDTSKIAEHDPIAKGLPASPGAASGAVYFTSADARAQADTGKSVIMVRQETSPDDIEGTIASAAVVTSRGGMTSHAAVVARGLGKCCVAGCEDLEIFPEKKIIYVGKLTIHEGDIISVDGNTGEIYLGEIPTMEPEPSPSYQRIMDWANEHRTLKIYANADTKKDLEAAVRFGAEGVGLARTEHMFFEKKKLEQMRILILSNDDIQRRVALNKLMEMQIHDFIDLYEVMNDRPITIRLLDPPLHEFLPTQDRDIRTLAEVLNISPDLLRQRIAEMTEVNPMLGHRGCRIGITSPEIYIMQVEAIMLSALSFLDQDISITPEIMIPLVGSENEVIYVRDRIERKIQAIFEETGKKIDYHIGTMIEIPRACLMADKIARHADFFSFGTNDLTQMTYGFSRDDIAKFIHGYMDKNILKHDPFQTLDQEGVGELIRTAVTKGRQVKSDLPIGICGEVGGDPTSIHFFNELGLTYVSSSPYRIPIATIAAAQAALLKKQ